MSPVGQSSFSGLSGPRAFGTRAELDAEIRACSAIVGQAHISLEKEGTVDFDFLEYAEAKEVELDELRRTRDSGQYPTIDELRCSHHALLVKARAAKSLAATRGLLKEMKILQEQIKKEEMAQEPHDIKISSDLVHQAVKDGTSENGAPELSMAFLEAATNDFTREIGNGGFATVYQGLDHLRATEFAVKRFNTSALQGNAGSEKTVEQIRREVEVGCIEQAVSRCCSATTVSYPLHRFSPSLITTTLCVFLDTT